MNMHYIVGTDIAGTNHEFIVVAASAEQAVERVAKGMYAIEWHQVQATPVPLDSHGHRIMVIND